ncbi:hypothetical protein EW146_g9942 [Bondarzewia mesenterica]|uniref:CDC48 N-terminal subdomain domain-containing protein n=1 Tax=Bondarzewia mesenterica TaxID=1095465 RepID=A0A4S4L395_9AGAM|nr:hypothetical protein EW146_g9942 [Bondarzewia mesenterica]
MASISSSTFIVRVADPEEVQGRASRRVLISSDTLKRTKLCAGDPVALVAADIAQKAYAVGIIWPSTELLLETVQAMPSLLLTAKLREGSKVQLFPFNVPQGQKLKSWLPSFKQAREAGTVRLTEINSNESLLPPDNLKEKKTRRDWLSLLVRESLVDLKYITPTQVVQVQYEGQMRRFAVSSVLSKRPAGDASVADLVDTLNGLSVESIPPLCIMDWETMVVIDDGTKLTVSEKPQIESLGPSANPEVYSSVGGLDKQIAQIRDLIEIPLTRPDLFRHFGESKSP